MAVEKDRWQFLHSQMRVVGCFSQLAPAETWSAPASDEVPEEESELEPDNSKCDMETDQQ